jgi:hypothetical protein
LCARIRGGEPVGHGRRPLPREIDPRVVYQRLFRASQPQSASEKQEKLLLDRVLEDSRRLRDRLGSSDRQRLDEYLEGVRSLEQRLQARAGSLTESQCLALSMR